MKPMPLKGSTQISMGFDMSNIIIFYNSENYYNTLILKKKKKNGVLDALKKTQRNERYWMQMNFKRKRDVSGNVERFKVILVAKGLYSR